MLIILLIVSVTNRENFMNLPTIEDELNRKAFEELENLIDRRSLGKITNAEYLSSINTLFAVCSGIVDKEFHGLILDAAKETKHDYSFCRTRVFEKGNKLTIITRTKDSNSFKVRIFNCVTLKDLEIKGDMDETDTNTDMELKLHIISEKLKKMNYQELTKSR